MGSLPASYFDALYAADPDPWDLGCRWYEQRKYALTLAALPRPRYASGFEPACSIGVLTAGLAPRCDHLLAADGAEAAVASARRRTAKLANVTVERRWLPEQWPQQRFDLVVLSELGYYLDGDRLDKLLDATAATLQLAGTLVAVHWRPTIPDAPLSGDAVHAAIDARNELRCLGGFAEERFRLDLYERA